MSNSRYYYLTALLTLNLSHTIDGPYKTAWGVASTMFVILGGAYALAEWRRTR